jgi:hypothetical protein
MLKEESIVMHCRRHYEKLLKICPIYTKTDWVEAPEELGSARRYSDSAESW